MINKEGREDMANMQYSFSVFIPLDMRYLAQKYNSGLFIFYILACKIVSQRAIKYRETGPFRF